MPLPRVRFTVRRLMVAVAIVAAVLAGLEALRMRRAEFQRVSVLHRRHLLTLGRWELLDPVAQRADEEAQARGDPRKSWHLHLADKYRRAARYPWLPVAPDPPEPE